MPRAINTSKKHNRRKKVLRQAKGYWGRRRTAYKAAREAVDHALQYAYRDRRVRKRHFRTLWIARLSAACRAHEITYSRFVQGLKIADVRLNRKALSNMAIEDPKAFEAVVVEAKRALESGAAV